ncbi:CoA-binding protein [Granulosicoccus antarcticus]|uniref:CoA-binding domain-containing protein n=1 Tax=Granulosicoccus antarcticus IMCC3135 TaxID=1192854 RepID=A0A2Z2P2K1_9GAMM|nr:CoA-binding protein [Granulosicoccus antarcticus]ASJ76548.1 hypothetical protein IMCC3135_32515 [Granulosicoccus antarcticus IMCC3135]
MNDTNRLQEILESCRTIAVVGLSNKPHRASYGVASYLLHHGYTIIPVNPTIDEVLGQQSYPTLSDIPVTVDMVDCFRRSEEMEALAVEAIAIRARVLWMQLGVVNEKARDMAEAAGLQVVMDRCTKIDHARLLGSNG